MAKEGFSWKSLFIVEDEKPEGQNPPEIDTTKFPTQSSKTIPNDNPNNPFISEIVGVYEKGFDSLNTPNFDFFEFYKSVITVGINNSQSYQMAFTMGSAMNPELNKASLIEKAKYYVSEIEKVHKNFEKTGSTKRNEINNRLNAEKQALVSSISDIEARIVSLQKELIEKKAELAKTDTLNSQEFSEIELKLEANEIAKQKLIQSINQVITGINQYLQ
jgi:uncharacterized small protein (DUF1192 family)